jgi:FSR family fosmidomycin resistance protein-like MFS transporter
VTRAATAPSSGILTPVSPTRVALVVACAHGLNDAYAAFLHPLLPRIMDRLGLSIALAATLATAFGLASSLLQPVAGYLSDRYGRRVFVVAGPVISAVFLSLIGVAPSFAALMALLVLGGLGSAAFHPPGASFAARIAEGGGSGLRFSLFSFGGALGFTVGPLLAVGIVAWGGLERLWLAMVPMLVLAPLVWRSLPSGRRERPARPPPGPATVLRLLVGPLGLVFGISAVAAFVQRVYLTLTPIIAAGDGRSEAAGALALSVYLGGQAIGTLAGGVLTDRLDRAPLLAVLTALAAPAHALALGLPSGTAGALTAAAAAGFLNMAMLPPLVILAQELVPEGAATGSSVAMGLAWATGSLMLPLAGALGDAIGPRPAALAVLPTLLIATALALHPALRRHPPRPGAAGPVPPPPMAGP